MPRRSLRDRSRTKRETFNVERFGHGGGGGTSPRSVRRSTRNNSDNREDTQRSAERNYRSNQRLNLGGKIRNEAYYRDIRHNHKMRNPKRKYDNFPSSQRKHFDSSSDSSGSDGGGGGGNTGRGASGHGYDQGQGRGYSDRGYGMGGNSRREFGRGGNSMHLSPAHGMGGMGMGGDEDSQFHQHENARLRDELSSIQPLDMGSVNHRGTVGAGGSIQDKVSTRDLARADVLPVAVDSSIGFDQVGGLEGHVTALKEMVVLPLLYPEVFEKFGTQPPRGVLFVGPPGTGKTLTARALANSLSSTTLGDSGDGGTGGKKVSFFMRKGADCLSKWVGEGERQLRLLFEQARRFEPSIIFFDEIDGLAPVRSVKQDQIHASIVSTLLALMDGLDPRGQVVVIGATNRPDAIDSALRRPGRFDRELVFRLPNAPARMAILDIHTEKWIPPLPVSVKRWVVDNSAGYCGADIKSLCAEAALITFRRVYPQVYSQNTRLNVDTSKLFVSRGDLAAAMTKIIPASRRVATASTVACPLDAMHAELLAKPFQAAVRAVGALFPPAAEAEGARQRELLSQAQKHTCQRADALGKTGGGATGTGIPSYDSKSLHTRMLLTSSDWSGADKETWLSSLADVDVDVDVNADSQCDQGSTSTWSSSSHDIQAAVAPGGYTTSSLLWNSSNNVVSGSRLLLVGPEPGSGQHQVASALLYHLESFPVISLDLSALITEGGASGCSPEQALILRIQEAYRCAPSVVFIPDLVNWWQTVPCELMRTTLLSMMEHSPNNLPVLWLGTLSMSTLGTSADGVISGGIDSKLENVINWFVGQEGGVASTEKSDHVVNICVHDDEVRRSFFTPFVKELYELPFKLLIATQRMIDTLNLSLKPQIREHSGVEESQSVHIFVSPTMEVLLQRYGTCSTTAALLNGRPGSGLVGVASKDIRGINEFIKTCHRELRVFFREALNSLYKTRKYGVFAKPVDPELYCDYYDVIKSPMDLDSMRMKIDEELYPTLQYFLYDLEIISFNAKKYNNSTDARSRSIIHAANSLLDEVSLHAHHFKKQLGYDLFSQCEDIQSVKEFEMQSREKQQVNSELLSPRGQRSTPRYRCTNALKSSDIPSFTLLKDMKMGSMPLQNKVYYEHMLVQHKELKAQDAEEERRLLREERRNRVNGGVAKGDSSLRFDEYSLGKCGERVQEHEQMSEGGSALAGAGAGRRTRNSTDMGGELMSLDDLLASRRKRKLTGDEATEATPAKKPALASKQEREKEQEQQPPLSPSASKTAEIMLDTETRIADVVSMVSAGAECADTTAGDVASEDVDSDNKEAEKEAEKEVVPILTTDVVPIPLDSAEELDTATLLKSHPRVVLFRRASELAAVDCISSELEVGNVRGRGPLLETILRHTAGWTTIKLCGLMSSKLHEYSITDCWK